MTKRKLGNSGIELSPLALGGNVFGWTIDEASSFRILDGFVDGGFNFIDTADVYSAWAPGNHGGESETIIGKWLKSRGRRSDVIIATKVGMELGPKQKGLSKTYVQRAVEASLKRLQTDYIDLYQSHKDDPDTPFEETLSAFDELIRSGKVRAIGASNITADRLAEALKVSTQTGLARYESLQPLYNLYDREDYEAQLQPLSSETGLGVITYYSLASGFLSGKYRSLADAVDRARGGTVTKYINERGLAILKALDAVAGDYSSTPAQVAIAWLIAQPTVTAPIVSATNSDQLSSLFKAVDLQLDDDAIKQLDQASAWRLEAASA
jgi:aryl-alcohol dehydrogenase-like predicted oxidoreductase